MNQIITNYDGLESIKKAGGKVTTGVNDPTAGQPAGTEDALSAVNTVLQYLTWGSAVAAIFAIVLIGIKIITARAGHSPENAAKALSGLPWIAGGLILIFASTTLVGALIQ